MLNADKILNEMDQLLDLLIENASKLLELSKQVISEEELDNLQKKQQDLLEKLVEKDEAFHQLNGSATHDDSSPLRNQIDDKLDVFQELNANFIDNITASHGMIHFEKGKIQPKSPKDKSKEK